MKTTLDLPLLPLRDVVVYPHMVIPLFVGREKSIEALEAAMTGEKQILLLAQKNPADDDPGEDALYRVGTVATVLQLLKLPDGTVKVLVEGEQRGAVERFTEVEGHIRAEVSLIDEVDAAERESEVFVRTLLSQFEQYVQLGKKVPAEVLSSLNSIEEPGRLVDTMAAHMALKIEQKQEILEIVDLATRVEHVLALLDAEIDLLQVEKRIRGRVKKQMERSQREYYLNEQMKAIQKELGDGDEGHNEVEELKKRIEAAGLPKDALTKAQAELNKLKQMSPMSAEATVVRSYLDWLVQVPWKAQSKVRLDLTKAEEILDADHYGLEEVKERILEYLAVQKRVKKIRGPVLCLVGPPGVGKTSLAESIAAATNRKFVRMALGGVRDEAEIRGHRRTYIGSMPGRLIQKMTKVGVRNPLFLLDEIDKMGSDMRGDPASALLEVLDPEQNHNFNDHYLEVDYDLSDVMFLCTSNSMNIPPALLDRMEVIRLPGYTEDEKINIAVKYLVPKQVKANGLKKEELEVDISAIRDIIRYYTREAGVRGLERQIAKVCRKVVKEHTGQKQVKVKVSSEQLEHLLGVRKFRYGLAEQQDQIGQVTGLAWTQVGGELLTIEAVVIPGKGQLIKTGSLGDVMVESITAAQTVVRSRARSLGIAADFHEKHDVHIHMPEGATPKDGPSAGVGMCTALVSALTQIPVRADVAMTGEITLRGQVLAIGGLKEKLLAAHRGGIKTVIIPEENVRDLKEIPENIKQDLQIKPVKWIDEVLQIALQYAPEPLPDVAPEIVAKEEKRDSDAKERISTH
ncbi:endopeptidase La [Pseudomonas kermanshahensis]|jgi:ATP-dependent Lon protease|uniref:Lon protease n=1 Tax=Pseudomonas kermanshahensis TaxID=2745482 RepID=A0ABU8R1X8_9PSED|nr:MULTISPECIES: endopeptidase La [Pseudomonas]ATP51108.1 endopeptidase La [Pseudomonas putida]MCX2686442.1 endopeptidase La [Pseudomonas sp. DCB_AW]USS57710.1 endopeptidase La [Pseudomonas kermanshahensis]UVL68569.1 endopeptidase La [Pseudomonas sp. B21-031]WEL57277.1 endopeptidase La [Pseudomonas kermanshahensis]